MPSSTALLVSRRQVLAGVSIGLALCALPAVAHNSIGPVKPPVEVPDIGIIASDGFRGSLREKLRGRATALQLMFTRCKSICPIDAATFARTQDALKGQASDGIQLLSLSIDPLTDTPDMLNAWLDNLNARPGWIAASPIEEDLARARKFFDEASSLGEDHTTAMSLINSAGQLVWRTSELPAPSEVVKLLNQLRKLG